MQGISNTIRIYLSLIKKMAAYFLYIARNKTKELPSFPVEEQTLTIHNRNHEQKEEIPRIIWMYWEEEELPTLVEKSIQKIRLLHPTYEVNLLNKKLVLDFLPDFEVSSEMPVANKTDLIRLELLYLFGGIWLDATVLIDHSLDWVHDVQATLNPDLIGYYRDRSTVDYNFPVIESWFIATPQNNEFIKQWLAELAPLKDLGSVTYFQMIQNRNDFDAIRQKIDRADYLLVYLACQIAMRNYDRFNLYLRRCEDSAFFIQEFYEWNPKKINHALCRSSNPASHPAILKLTSGDRYYFQLFYDLGLVKKNSVAARFLR